MKKTYAYEKRPMYMSIDIVDADCLYRIVDVYSSVRDIDNRQYTNREIGSWVLSGDGVASVSRIDKIVCLLCRI